MTTLGADDRNAELAAFLRARRARIQPQDVGLPPHGSRSRTKGLRREEVAQLAGIGVTWYTLLESGRPISVSRKLLQKIGDVLRLNVHETTHLIALARVGPGVTADTPSAQAVDQLLSKVIAGFTAGPAFVVSPRFDLLAYNDVARKVYGYDRWSEGLERNILWHLYTEPAKRSFHDNWESSARTATALFRANYGRRLDDPDFNALIQLLHESSPDFVRFWAEPVVLPLIQMDVRLHHDEGGLLIFEQQSLVVPQMPDTHIRFHVPKDGTDCGDRLSRLLV